MGLPEGARPYEDSPACEIDETLLTHLGPEELPVHQR